MRHLYIVKYQQKVRHRTQMCWSRDPVTFMRKFYDEILWRLVQKGAPNLSNGKARDAPDRFFEGQKVFVANTPIRALVVHLALYFIGVSAASWSPLLNPIP